MTQQIQRNAGMDILFCFTPFHAVPFNPIPFPFFFFFSILWGFYLIIFDSIRFYSIPKPINPFLEVI